MTVEDTNSKVCDRLDFLNLSGLYDVRTLLDEDESVIGCVVKPKHMSRGIKATYSIDSGKWQYTYFDNRNDISVDIEPRELDRLVKFTNYITN